MSLIQPDGYYISVRAFVDVAPTEAIFIQSSLNLLPRIEFKLIGYIFFVINMICNEYYRALCNDLFHVLLEKIITRKSSHLFADIRCMHLFYYTLSHKYRVVRTRYSRLLFTSEDRICANLRVQEHSTNMTSQCQYPTFAWRHRSTVVTSQYQVWKHRP